MAGKVGVFLHITTSNKTCQMDKGLGNFCLSVE